MPIFSYALHPRLPEKFPVSISCSTTYRHNSNNSHGTISVDMRLCYSNISLLKVTDMESLIRVPGLHSLQNLSHYSTIGDDCSVSGTHDGGDCLTIRVSFPKLKSGKEISVSLTVEVEQWSILSHLQQGMYDESRSSKSVVDSSFSIMESKNSQKSKNSIYSHVGIRYINVTSGGDKSSKIPLRLKISYKVVSLKTFVREVHEGLSNVRIQEVLSTSHYNSSEIEMHWSDSEENDTHSSDSVDDDEDEGRTIIVHRPNCGDSVCSRTSHLQKRNQTFRRKGVVDTDRHSPTRDPHIVEANHHGAILSENLNMSAFPIDNHAQLVEDTIVSSERIRDRPTLHIQLSDISLEEEVTRKRVPPTVPPPSSMKPIQLTDKVKRKKKSSQSSSQLDSVNSNTKHPSKKIVSLTIDLGALEENNI